MYGNGNKSHRNKEERTLSVTFGRGDGDKVSVLMLFADVRLCGSALQWDSEYVDSRWKFVYGIEGFDD